MNFAGEAANISLKNIFGKKEKVGLRC